MIPIIAIAFLAGLNVGLAFGVISLMLRPKPKVIRYEPWLQERLIFAPIFSGDYLATKLTDEVIERYQGEFIAIVKRLDEECMA